MATLSAPTSSPIVSRTFKAISSVLSMCVPSAARNRNEERSYKGRRNAEHRERPRKRGLHVSPPHRQGDRIAVLELRVDVFDFDRGLIDKDAHGKRQAPQRHQVDRLPAHPQADEG